MGICYIELGRYKDALAKIKETLKLDKNLTVEEHYRYGEVYTELKDSKKAITQAIILQRLQVDKKLLKEVARSRESLNALSKKYKVTPDVFKKVITPSNNY